MIGGGCFYMDTNKNELIVLNEQYGMTILPVEQEEFKGYKRITDSDFAKLNACFRDIPQMIKTMNDTRFYSGSYKVIYDRGLGVLQKSAKDPNLFRANIVAQGTNNDITGQALLQELKPNELMKVSNLMMSAFSVAAVVTNQYYMARIENRLGAIENKVNEIQRFLEIDKESQLWADGEFLKETRNNVEYIISDDTYRQSTLTNVQSIRRVALSNIKLYYEQLFELKELLDIKDNVKETASNIDKYKGYLPKFWYSVYLYELSYYVEAYLSKITDEMFLKQITNEMEKIVGMFNEAYDVISDEIGQYINTVKSLKANEVPANIMKSVGKVLELTRIPVVNPLFSYGAKGLGVAFDLGGDYLIKNEKSKKKAKKQEVIEGLEAVIKPYSDLEPLNFQIDAVENMNFIYNNKLEIIMTEQTAYIKYETKE